MSDHKARPTIHEAKQGLLDGAGPSVHTAGSLIENQDSRVRKYRPSNGQQLTLPWLRLLPRSESEV